MKSVLVHICHSGGRYEDIEFKASPSYIVRPCLKKRNKEKKRKENLVLQLLLNMNTSDLEFIEYFGYFM
jgi:hypothetical protein